MHVLGIDHVVVICSDVENTLAWWQRELGLDPLRLEAFRDGTAPFPSLRLNPNTILDFVVGERTGENVAHVAIEVDADADRLEALVGERGWDVAVPLDRSLFGARGIGAGVYIRDPEGNVLELRTYAG
jgi:catechol 2,3-dioxygenase-like lactoylglutathione lyase family enzyme